jgi:hypothetical protein
MSCNLLLHMQQKVAFARLSRWRGGSLQAGRFSTAHIKASWAAKRSGRWKDGRCRVAKSNEAVEEEATRKVIFAGWLEIAPIRKQRHLALDGLLRLRAAARVFLRRRFAQDDTSKKTKITKPRCAAGLSFETVATGF